MVMREISLYVLLGQLLIAGVGSVCVPVGCLRCDVSGKTAADSCPPCSNDTAQCIKGIRANCTKDFQVHVNSTGSNVDEGKDITLTCVHNLPPLNLKFEWKKDEEEVLEGQNKSRLVLIKTSSKNKGQYTCRVISPCGNYKSPPHDVAVNNNSLLLLLICGVSAVVLVVMLGLAMKFKLQRDNAKHKERQKQRAQAGQSGGPAPFTPRAS